MGAQARRIAGHALCPHSRQWLVSSNRRTGCPISVLSRQRTGQQIFVHCRFGDDRTGVFIATYRMTFEKWPADQAMKEMYFFGFNGFWHPAMKSFVRDFPARLNSSPALAPLRTQSSQPCSAGACRALLPQTMFAHNFIKIRRLELSKPASS